MADETNPNRWTAEVRWISGWAVQLKHPTLAMRSLWCDTEEQANKLTEQINRPAPTTPADDQPPGVVYVVRHQYCVHGVYADPEAAVAAYLALPDGDKGWSKQEIIITPAEPATEWVPLHEALRDCRKIQANGVAWVDCRQVRMLDGRVQVGTPGIGWALVNADGKVEVQR
jgi:hypothetical protein